MNSNDDERSIVTVDNDTIIGGCRTQGNNVANSNRSTVKIDSLSIKLGINVKEKSDADKCRHFSIRGYVAGMRERGGSSSFLPFMELPPMDIPNFRYWLCQRCLQKDGTSHDTATVVSVCDQCLAQPCVRSCPPQDHAAVSMLPFGEGTSGLKPVDSRNSDQSLRPSLGAEKCQSLQEIPLSQQIPAKVNVSSEVSAKVKVSHEIPAKAKVSDEIPPKGKVSQEIPKFCSTDTNVATPGKKDLKAQEEPQKKSLLKESVSRQMESGQQNDCPKEHPRRKARKVRLLKELLCGNTEIQQQKKENCSPSPLADSSQIKRKTQHDRHLTDDDHAQRSVDVKKAKNFKGNAVTKPVVVVEQSRENPAAHESGETINKFQWNKVGTPRKNSVGSDAMTAWRSIFNDNGSRPENQVTPTLSVSKGRGTEPYSNLMAPPKPDKKFNTAFSKKISSNPIRSKFLGEDSRNTKDLQSDTELCLSLNYDPEAHTPRSLPPVQNQILSQDQSRKPGFFLGESSNFSNSKEGWGHDDVINRLGPRIAVVQEQRLYTHLPYGSCFGNQNMDFSDPHKRNTGVRGYTDVTRPHHHQRQDNMFSVGRSDEREIIELMAKNQYERNLCEARSHFSPNAAVFGKVNTNEGIPSSHHDYLGMIRPMNENLGPTTMRSSGFTVFDGLTQSQKQPTSGVWITNSGPQRHYDSSRFHHMLTKESSYKYNNGSYQNESASLMPYGQTYGKYSEKDKGKNMMNLDLNIVAPNVVEEHNNDLESLDSSYSNETIPAMQLLSLMDAGKSSQHTNNSQKPLSPIYSQCGSTANRKTNHQIVNSHFTYSGLRHGLQYSNGSSFSNVVHTGQNVDLRSSHGQQKGDKSRFCRPEDSFTFPLPWHATEDRNKLVNGVFGPGFGLQSGTEMCTINRNPADFSTPGPENTYMVSAEDLMFNGPKRQKVNKVQ